MQWASTIPQQLIRNLLLTKDRKLERKLKEIILTSKLSGVLEDQIRKEKTGISSSELRTEMKKRTLELYLDYISFGNNAFGVEAASKAYFDKSAKDLTVLEASVLASIPKWPSLYDPYRNRGLVMGEFTIKDSYGNPVLFSGDVKQQVISKFKTVLTASDLSRKKQNNDVVKFIDGIGSFKITVAGNVLNVKYENGRKDYILSRMYEDGYITETELKDALVQGMDYIFRQNIFPIKAPHFVHRVTELLNEMYGSWTLMKGWFVVKTTLDLKIQEQAEKALLANNSALQSNWANDSALLYLDTKKWDVLAYVGSIDYFNQEIQWQNDMVRSPRQSGSSVKPFIYAIGLEKLPLTLDTPIFDIPFQIGPDKPNDADDKFEGMLPVRKALGHSRNIPATKMITAIWGELAAKPFLHKLGLSWVSDNVEYGYTLALGAAEVPMLQLANAYAHLSTDTPGVINPILEVRSRDGSLLYEKTWSVSQTEVINPAIRSLVRKILSDSTVRIIGWETKFNVGGLTFGLKTGTSDVKTPKWNRPRDGLLAAYTPSKVLMLWMWNADASPMNQNAFGWSLATPFKALASWMLKNNYISNETMPESSDVVSVKISKITWKLAGPSTPSSLVVDTLKYKNWPALAIDNGATALQYDGSCGGQVSAYTSPLNIKNGFLFQPTTFMPNGMDLSEITQRWKESVRLLTGGEWWGFSSGKVYYNYNSIFVEAPQTVCSWVAGKIDTNIKVSVSTPGSNSTITPSFSLSYTASGPKNIRRITVFLDTQALASFDYPQGNTKTVSDTKQVSVGTGFKNGSHVLQVVAVDFAWFSNSKSVDVVLGSQASQPAPTTPPVVTPTVSTFKFSESSTKITQDTDGTYTVSLFFTGGSISQGTVTRNGTPLSILKSANKILFTTESLWVVAINVQDANKNTVSQTVDLGKYFK